MFFRVTRFLGDTGKPKLVPEANVTHDEARVSFSENEKLGADAEGGEGYLGEHGVGATRRVTVVEVGFVGEDFDEALVGVLEEVVVGEVEGEERDAVLGEEGEEVVFGVVEERGGEEAACGGDEGGVGAGGGFGGDEAGAGKWATRDGDGDGGVGVDVDVVKVRG